MIKTSAQLVQDAKQIIEEIDVEQLNSILDQKTVLIDVREPQEFASGHIDQAMNFPRGVLEMQLPNHPNVKNETSPLEQLNQNPIYLICRSGARSALAAESLGRMGFSRVISIAGGMVSWEQAGYQMKK